MTPMWDSALFDHREKTRLVVEHRLIVVELIMRSSILTYSIHDLSIEKGQAGHDAEQT